MLRTKNNTCITHKSFMGGGLATRLMRHQHLGVAHSWVTYQTCSEESILVKIERNTAKKLVEMPVKNSAAFLFPTKLHKDPLHTKTSHFTMHQTFFFLANRGRGGGQDFSGLCVKAVGLQDS